MGNADQYLPTAREQAFLAAVESPRYDRQSVNGLKPFLDGRVPDEMRDFYSTDELAALRELKRE